MKKYFKIKEQMIGVGLFKIGNLGLNYLLFSIIIRMLGVEDFGIYVALTSLLSWMFLFDFGMAKGMRNKISSSLVSGDYAAIQKSISTTYISLITISVLTLGLIYYLNVPLTIASKLELKINDSRDILNILLIGFFVRFALSPILQIFHAIHKSQYVILGQCLVLLINIVLIVVLKDDNVSLKLAIDIYAISISLPYALLSIVFFVKEPVFFPKLTSFDTSEFKMLFKVGGGILFVQLGFLLFIGLDRLILLKYGTPTSVSSYEVYYKIMSVLLLPFGILTAPLWSSFNAANADKNYAWIQRVFIKFYKSFLALVGFALILAGLSNVIIDLWLGLVPTSDISFLMAFLLLSIMWSTFHTDFLLSINSIHFPAIVMLLGIAVKFVFLNYYIDSIDEYTVVISSILAYSIYNLVIPIYCFNKR